jgi:hypothetical protein
MVTVMSCLFRRAGVRKEAAVLSATGTDRVPRTYDDAGIGFVSIPYANLCSIDRGLDVWIIGCVDVWIRGRL